MIAAITALFGFLSSGVPHLLEFFKDKQDNKHELEMLRLQAEIAKIETSGKLDAADLELQSTAYKSMIDMSIADINRKSGTQWVDALNATVRPVIAYSFFALYAAVKYAMLKTGMTWNLWTEEDTAIFSGIIAYYFGARGFTKARGSK